MCAVLVPEDLFAPGELTPDSFTYGIIFVMSIFMAGVVATSWPPWLRGEGQRAMVERIAKLAIAAPLSAAGLGMEAIAATSLSNLRNAAWHFRVMVKTAEQAAALKLGASEWMTDVSFDERRLLSVFVKRGAEAPITLWMNPADYLSAGGMMRVLSKFLPAANLCDKVLGVSLMNSPEVKGMVACKRVGEAASSGAGFNTVVPAGLRGPYIIKLIPRDGDPQGAAIPQRIDMPLAKWGLVAQETVGGVNGVFSFTLQRPPAREAKQGVGAKRSYSAANI